MRSRRRHPPADRPAAAPSENATSSWNSSNDMPIRSAVCSVIAVTMKPGATQFTRDPEPAELDRERLRQSLDPRLRRRVVRLAAVSECRGRRDQDDRAASLSDHVRLSGLSGEKRPLQMRVDHRFPVVVRHLVDEVVAQDPGAGDEDVQSPRRLGRSRDRRLDVRPRRDVAAHGTTADRGCRLLGRRKVEVRHDDVGSLGGEPGRRRSADAASARP